MSATTITTTAARPPALHLTSHPSISSCPTPTSSSSSSSAPSPAATARKIRDLTQLEACLLSASESSLDRGHCRRAESYNRQALAVRAELERWTLLAQSPAPPSPVPHLLPAALCVVIPLLHLCTAGGLAARRLAHAVFAIGLLVLGVVLGTSTPSAWPCSQQEVVHPEHWANSLAQHELRRKQNAQPHLHYLLRRNCD